MLILSPTTWKREKNREREREIHLQNNTLILLYFVFIQIVNWRTHLKFPEEAKLSTEAKDLVGRLLCNVNQRLGAKGADEIKVLCGVSNSKSLHFLHKPISKNDHFAFQFFRLIHGLMVLIGIRYTKWKLHLSLQSLMNWILKILRSLKRYNCPKFPGGFTEPLVWC